VIILELIDGGSRAPRFLRFDSIFLVNTMINTIKILSKHLVGQITSGVVHTIDDIDRIRGNLPELFEHHAVSYRDKRCSQRTRSPRDNRELCYAIVEALALAKKNAPI